MAFFFLSSFLRFAEQGRAGQGSRAGQKGPAWPVKVKAFWCGQAGKAGQAKMGQEGQQGSGGFRGGQGGAGGGGGGAGEGRGPGVQKRGQNCDFWPSPPFLGPTCAIEVEGLKRRPPHSRGLKTRGLLNLCSFGFRASRFQGRSTGTGI